MKHALFAGAALAVSAILLAQTVSAAPAPAPTWSASAASQTVPFNQSLDVEVWGPPHATFYVSVSVPPFNQTPPVATYFYVLGNATTNETQASVIAAIPTGDLLFGSEMLRVYNDTFGDILFLHFDVLPPANATVTQLENEVTELWALYYAQVNHTIALQGDFSATQAYVQKVVVLIFLTLIFCVLLVIWTRPEVDVIGWIRRAKALGRSIIKEETAIRIGYAGPEVTDTMHPHPSSSWVGAKRFRAFCVGCRVPSSRTWRIAHMISVHAIKDPAEPRDFELDARSVKGYMEEARLVRPVPVAKPRKTPGNVEKYAERSN